MKTGVDKRQSACTLVWLRRDLRLNDHAALARALEFAEPIQIVFIFDRDILQALPGHGQTAIVDDRRVAFIHGAVAELSERLNAGGAHLITAYDRASEAVPKIAQAVNACRVIFAHDDEPDARERDQSVTRALQDLGCQAISVKDQCIFERSEVLTGLGKPFSVFTPYKNAWLKKLTPNDLASRTTHAGLKKDLLGKKFSERLLTKEHLPKTLHQPMPSLAEMGFGPGNLSALQIPLGESGAQKLFADFQSRISHYKVARDFPAVKGPSYLSVHLRFGTISIRELARFAWECSQKEPPSLAGAATWLSELIWRDFYMQILYHHPHVVRSSFKSDYDAIKWEQGAQAKENFQRWCDGQTGYPLVDAGMRQLNATGYMHNRLRMVVASFLTKDLGIDWRWGEKYFAWKLNDFDLSANNGGWQWAASTGCDAQPYFRIFNPVTQSERFDEKGAFIRRYVPEIAALSDRSIHAPWMAPALELQAAQISLGKTYPAPIVDHDQARKKTLARFAVVKG